MHKLVRSCAENGGCFSRARQRHQLGSAKHAIGIQVEPLREVAKKQRGSHMKALETGSSDLGFGNALGGNQEWEICIDQLNSTFDVQHGGSASPNSRIPTKGTGLHPKERIARIALKS